MKRRIVSLILLLTMLITAIPFAASAETEAPVSETKGDVSNLLDLYADGMTAHFTTLGGASGVDLAAGTWTDLVAGKTATLGNASRWSLGASGGVGFNTYCGEMADGAFTASSAGNNYTDKTARLDFGISLLPEGDFTVEYTVTYKPVYVYDATAPDHIARDAQGKPIETYAMDKTATGKYAQAGGGQGMIDAFGYFTTMTDNLDGDYYNARGDQHFMFNWTGNWDASASNWVGARDWNAVGGLDKADDVFAATGTTNTYAVTLDETRTADALTALIAIHRGGVLYADNSDEINSTANGTGDAGYIDADYATEKFFLSASRPTDFYAVRIYNKVLTADELEKNRAVDAMLYYGITLSDEVLADDAVMTALYGVFASVPFATDATEKALTAIYLASAVETTVKETGEKESLLSLYAATDRMTSLFTTYVPSTLDLAAGTWTDLVAGKTATLGNASRWSLSASGGVGFNTYCGELANGEFTASSTGNNYTDMTARLDFGISLLPEDDFTVEYLAMYKPVYVYDGANADRIARDAYGNKLETYDYSTTATTNHATRGPLDYVGYFTAFTNALDATYYERGDIHWIYNSPTWGSKAGQWVGGGNWNAAGGLNIVGNVFQTNSVLRSYAIVLDETKTETETTALLALYRDAALYKDNSDALNTTLNGEADGGYMDAPFTTQSFYLSASRPVDFYTVRIYDKALTADEMAQNRAVDVMLYYNLDVAAENFENAGTRALLIALLSGAPLETDATMAAAKRVELQALVDELRSPLLDMYAAKENLTALFTTAVSATVNVAAGTWSDLVGGKVATLGNPSRWSLNASGGVGFNTFCGEMVDGTFTASSAGNNYKDKTARLDFGIALLPEGDFTVEYMATYKPVYVYDATAPDHIARDAEGNPIETYAMDKNATAKYAQAGGGQGMIDAFGYFTTMTDNLDGDYYNARGDQHFMFNWTGNWDASASNWVGARDWSDMGGLDKNTDVFAKTGATGTYAVTLDEERVDGALTASFAIHRNGALYASNADEINSTANGTGDAGYIDADYATEKFFLSASRPTDFYSVRIYDKALSPTELAQNHMANLLAFYGMELPRKLLASDTMKAELSVIVAGLGFETEAVAYASTRLRIEDAIDAVTAGGEVYSLYVTDGLVANFTALSPTDLMASVDNGLWANRVINGAHATLGGAEHWYRRDNGAVGFRIFYGMINEAGVYTENSAYNNLSAYGTRLDFGIGMLPKDDFTVEYVAQHNPMYVADRFGNPVGETYLIAGDTPGNQQYSGDYSAPVHQLGYLQAWTNHRDGVHAGITARGGVLWTTSYPTGAGGTFWGNACALWAGMNDSATNPFAITGEVHTYSITRTEEIGTSGAVEGTYVLLRDSARYATRTTSILETANQGVNGAGAHDFAVDDVGYFYLSERISTEFYAVRIYDRAIDAYERAQNHLVDIILYYDLAVDDRFYTDAGLLSAAAEALCNAEIVTDATERAAKRVAYAAKLDALLAAPAERTEYEKLYVQNDMVGLFTAFAGDYSLDMITGMWKNEVAGGEFAMLRGLPYWERRAVGVGYSMGVDDWNNYAKSVGVSLPESYGLMENFTVEAFATVEGITNEDGTRFYNAYSPAVEDADGNVVTPQVGKKYGYYKLQSSAFRFGLLSSLFFASLDASPIQSMSQRWYLCNEGYSGSEHSATVAEALYKQIGTNASGDPVYDYNDQSWRLMGEDTIPRAGVMQVTRVTADDGSVTFAIAYNGSETPVQSVTVDLARYTNLSAVPAKNDVAGRFSLFNALPATVYAVRVYNRTLTAKEKLQNSFVDKAALYSLDLTGFDTYSEEKKTEIYERFATVGTDLSPTEAQAIYDFCAKADASVLAEEIVSFVGYEPILSGAYGYRAVFAVNQHTVEFFETLGYTVSYGALVAAAGGSFTTTDSVTVGASGVTILRVCGEGGTGVYYNLAGADGYYYTAAVTAESAAHMGVDVIVRAYVALVDAQGNVSYLYDDAIENEYLDGMVSVADAADYFVNRFEGDTRKAYDYMNAATLRDTLAICGIPARVALADDLTIYVDSANGSDENSGLAQDTAYKTVEAAFGAAKAHLGKTGRKSVTVRLAEGTYHVNETMTLAASDVLADAYSLRVVGSGEGTVLTSARAIDTSDAVYDEVSGAAIVQLPADENGEYPALRALYADGELLDVAHGGTNEDHARIEEVTFEDASGNTLPKAATTNDWTLSAENAALAKYAVFHLPLEMFRSGGAIEYAGAELHFSVVWTAHVLPIDHVVFGDETAAVYVPYATFPSVNAIHSMAGRAVWIENALPLLYENEDTYVYDEASGKIYFMENNVSLAENAFSYAALETLFVLDGVKNVTLTGFTATGLDSRLIEKDAGLSQGQAASVTLRYTDGTKAELGFPRSAAIYAKNTDGVTVSHVTVRDTLGAGVVFAGISQNVLIDANRFENLGDSAIRMGDSDLFATSYNKNVAITDNYVNGIGTLYNAAVAIQTTATANAKLVGNTIVNVPYTGISIGWSWTTVGYTAGEIIAGSKFSTFATEVAYNYISDYMTCMYDGGAIYLLGGNTGKHADDGAFYNYMHHNYVNMTDATGNHNGNENGLRFAMGYYHDNSSSNWLDYENVLINTAKEIHGNAWFYAYFLQDGTGAEARHVALRDNYIIGVRKNADGTPNLKDVFMDPEVVSADFGKSSSDYVYYGAAELAANTSVGVHTYGNAVTKASPADASTTVAAIFAAAGSSLTPDGVKVSGLSWTEPAAEREVLTDAERVDAGAFDAALGTVTFTDGQTSVPVTGTVGGKVRVPAVFAQKSHVYTFTLNGEAIDPETLRITTESVTVTVTATPAYYTLTLYDGAQTLTLSPGVGERFTLPESFRHAGYASVCTVNGVRIDPETFVMPSENVRVRVAYELLRYVVTFRDTDGAEVVMNRVADSVVPMPSGFVKTGYDTRYSVDGEEIVFGEFTVPRHDVTVLVEYLPKTYDVVFVNRVGETETVYATISTHFGSVITLPEPPASFEDENYVYTFSGWVGYTEGMVLSTEGMTFYSAAWTATEKTPTLTKGDINGDGAVDITDITAIISKASGAELDPEIYTGETDLTGDGAVDISDITEVIAIAAGSAAEA